MIYIAFTGHRDKNTTIESLDSIAKEYPNAIWVHGGANGFDSQIQKYAFSHGIRTKIIKPDYIKYADRPKYAPLARNQEIVDLSRCLYACYDGRNTGGTKFTIDYAKKKNKEVFILPVFDI